MNHRDDEITRRIKRMIKRMTEFRSMESKNIQEVEEEYQGYFLYKFIVEEQIHA